MTNLTDWIAITLSMISLIGAGYSFRYTRKTFIYSVCTERAKEVRTVWNNTSKVANMITVKDENYQLWSDVISEIVASIIIIDRLANRYKLIKRLYNINDFYIIFWQQIPTNLREPIELYSESLTEPVNNFEAIFRSQMKTILKTYPR